MYTGQPIVGRRRYCRHGVRAIGFLAVGPNRGDFDNKGCHVSPYPNTRIFRVRTWPFTKLEWQFTISTLPNNEMLLRRGD